MQLLTTWDTRNGVPSVISDSQRPEHVTTPHRSHDAPDLVASVRRDTGYRRLVRDFALRCADRRVGRVS